MDRLITTFPRNIAYENAGIVADEKRGQMIFYTLTMPCTLNFLSCLGTVIKQRAREQLALVAEAD